MTIHYLGTTAYEGVVSTAPLGGRLADSHIGWIRIPGQPNAVQAVVKVYPPEAFGETRQLLNEFVGYFVADKWSFPTPPNAGIVRIPRRQWGSLPFWRRFPSGTKDCVAWWSEKVPLKSVSARFRFDVMTNRTPLFDKQLEQLIQELSKSPSIAATIAFDEIIANIDRNVGNVLGPSQNQYYLIDHGSCLTGPRWHRSNLSASKRYENVLRDLLKWDSNMPLPIRSEAVATFDRIQSKVEPSLKVLGEELRGLLPSDDVIAILEFLRARSSARTAGQRMGLVA